MLVGVYGKSGSCKTCLSSKFRKNNFYIINLDYVAKLVLKKLKEDNKLKKLFYNLKFTIYNDLHKTLMFNIYFSNYLSHYLSPILVKKNINWIIEGATVNFLNFKFDFLFCMYKKNNIRKKHISKFDFKKLLDIQKYTIKYSNKINDKINIYEINTNLCNVLIRNKYKNILKILNI